MEENLKSDISITNYKDLQRSFVSNLNGTTTFELSVITSVLPLSVFLRSILWFYVTQPGKVFSGSLAFLMEYFTLVVPTLLVFTIMADHAFTLIMLSLAVIPPIIGNIILLSKKESNDTKTSESTKPFLCNFRAYVNIATTISILAVDFIIYPRRFAKTETFGTGLMDVGVGSFIFSNAIVSHEARGFLPGKLSVFSSIKTEIKAVSLLLCLGAARFLTVKGTDYQEHVSEYGVHWNFFLTLAFVRVFSTIILRILPNFLRKNPWIFGVVIGLFYEYILSNGLKHFVLHGSIGDGSRTNFIDANREGICSSLGYLSLYFIGIGIGKLIFQTKQNNLKCNVNLLSSLVFVIVLSWVVLYFWIIYVELISRRFANFAYVLWQVAYNVQSLAMFLLVDILFMTLGNQNIPMLTPGGCALCFNKNERNQSSLKQNILHRGSSHNSRTELDLSVELKGQTTKDGSRSHADLLKTVIPDDVLPPQCFCLISAVNFNQLGYFLIANVFTGVVNLSMETINASKLTAFLILNLYLLTLNTLIMILYRHKVLLKL